MVAPGRHIRLDSESPGNGGFMTDEMAAPAESRFEILTNRRPLVAKTRDRQGQVGTSPLVDHSGNPARRKLSTNLSISSG